MMTEAGYAEAKKRHDFMLFFLRQFFEEQGCSEWIDYLEQYENTITKKGWMRSTRL